MSYLKLPKLNDPQIKYLNYIKKLSAFRKVVLLKNRYGIVITKKEVGDYNS